MSNVMADKVKGKQWKDIDELGECNVCGYDSIEIFTDCENDGFGLDGDKLRCKNCGASSAAFVTDEDEDEDGNPTGILNAEEFVSAVDELEKLRSEIERLQGIIERAKNLTYLFYGESEKNKDIRQILDKARKADG
mgnify:CR=1 FL=1